MSAEILTKLEANNASLAHIFVLLVRYSIPDLLEQER